jgi:integrase/recombinase XerD
MITLEPLLHGDRLCIAIRGKYGPNYTIINNYPSRRYSATHGCFYVEHSEETLADPFSCLSRNSLCEKVGWHEQLIQEKQRSVATMTADIPNSYEEELIKMRYSSSTRQNYVAQFKAFLIWLSPKTADDFSEADVHDYLFYMVSERNVSYSLQNQAINAIKFFNEHVKKGERKTYYIERPRRPLQLPTVLSQEEISDLINCTVNLKHRFIIILLYSSGLRISELLGLRKRDIDINRNLIQVRGGKGNKDRITLLSSVAAEIMLEYLSQYQPGEFVIEGPDGGPYSARSVNNMLKNRAQAAGIEKDISAHTLRHTFATHLLEQGTDLRYIQTFLGHESSKTTERYAHVTKKGYEQIVSPLDRIFQKSTFKTNKEI